MNNSSESSNIEGQLELLFLGTGNAFSMDNRYWGSILVNDNILFDASPIVVPHMKKLGRKLSSLEYIFITHFHGDHFLGVPFLLLDYAYLTSMDHPLHIIGPSGIERIINQTTEIGFTGLADKLQDRAEINFTEILHRGDYSVNGLDFTAVPMAHGNHEAYGYKLPFKEKILSYTGDTGPCKGLEELAKDSDILITELSNPDDDVPGHMSIEKLEQLQKKVQKDKDLTIIINHVGESSGNLSEHHNWLLPNDLDVLKF